VSAGAWLALALVALLLFPSANYHLFDGLPLASAGEFAALVLVLPVFFSQGLRRLWARNIRQLGRPAVPALLAASCVALILKLLLMTSGGAEGFKACYHSLVERLPDSPCEKSYDNPWHRFTATRIDGTIDFEPGTWNLSFVNSLRFNYYGPGTIPRERLPFGSMWLGEVSHAEPRWLHFTYAGEVSVHLDEETIALPPHYEDVRRESLLIPAGRHPLVVSFRFDGGPSSGSGPYATLRLSTTPPGSDTGESLAHPVPPPVHWQLVARVVDAVSVALLASLIVVYASLLTRRSALLLAIGGIAPLAGYLLPPLALANQSLYTASALVLLMLHVAARRQTPRRHELLTIYWSLALLLTADTLRGYPSLGHVVLRDGGNDWLMYESYARSILETWSLQGGRDVFYFQPMFRYVRFGEHLLLGDGDALIAVTARMSLNFAVFWACWSFRQRSRPELGPRLLATTSAILLLLLLNSEAVVGLIRAGASEYPTWILLPVVLTSLFCRADERQWLFVGGSSAGLMFTLRSNQVLGVGWLLTSFLVSMLRKRRTLAAIALTSALGVALLPLAHNLYYGGEAVLATTSRSMPENLVLSPSSLLSARGNPEAIQMVRQQLDGVLYTGGANERQALAGGGLRNVIRGIQALWIVTLIASFRRGSRDSAEMRLLLLTPVLFLAVHLFYQVMVFYPRHITIGYLSMALTVAFFWLSRAARRPRIPA
jgi:hypothetical protein|tara:strand:- start:1608 stop:3749 length:2142 start_codon:yes stop_codon:yes gene_type:complete